MHTQVSSLVPAAPQEVLQENLFPASSATIPAIAQCSPLENRDFIPFKITQHWYFYFPRLKLNLTDMGIRIKG